MALFSLPFRNFDELNDACLHQGAGVCYYHSTHLQIRRAVDGTFFRSGMYKVYPFG